MEDLTELEGRVTKVENQTLIHKVTLFGPEGKNGMAGRVKKLEDTQAMLLKHLYLAIGGFAVLIFILDKVFR